MLNLRQKIDLVQNKLAGTGLKARNVNGAILLSVGTVVHQGSRFASRIILTRLLAPNEFGLMAIVIALSAIFESLSDIGVRMSVIQNQKGRESEYLNVAWWFQAVRAVGLFLIGFFASPYIAHFYSNPKLIPLLQVGFVSVLCLGLISPRVYVLEKDLNFKKWSLIKYGSGVLSIIITVVLAVIFRNVWCLVIGFITESFLQLLFSFLLCPFYPRPIINRTYLREILKFAQEMLGVPLLAYIGLQLDVFVIGKMLSMNELGKYTLACSLAQMPLLFFTQIIGPLMLPTFSAVQNNMEKTTQAVYLVTRYSALYCFALITFLIFFSHSILILVYGPVYGDVSLTFSLLCVYVAFRIFIVPLTTVLYAAALPHLDRRLLLLKCIVLSGIICPLTYLGGLSGAAMALVISNFVAVAVQLSQVCKITTMTFHAYLSNFAPACFAMLGVGITCLIIKFLPLNGNTQIIVALIFSVVTLFFLYHLGKSRFPFIRPAI